MAWSFNVHDKALAMLLITKSERILFRIATMLMVMSSCGILLFFVFPNMLFANKRWNYVDHMTRYGDWTLIDERENMFNPRLSGTSGHVYYSLSIRDVDPYKNYKFTFSCNAGGVFLNIDMATKDDNAENMQNGFVVTFQNYTFYYSITSPSNLSIFEKSAIYEHWFLKARMSPDIISTVSMSKYFDIKIMNLGRISLFHYEPQGTAEAFKAFVTRCDDANSV